MKKTQMQMYIDNLPKFVEQHKGKIIAVRNGELLGVYSSKLLAWRDMKKRNLQEGEFVIVECMPNESDYVMFWATSAY